MNGIGSDNDLHVKVYVTWQRHLINAGELWKKRVNYCNCGYNYFIYD